MNMQIMRKSILAGILIGLGDIILLSITPKILGAVLFSFGLVTIINMQLYLFTGKIGFLYKNNISQMLYILIFNLIGIAGIIGLYSIANPSFITLLSAAATIKFEKKILTLFINAIFCGMLIHFAVKNKNIFITVMSVVIFILIGAQHCIADLPYLLVCFSFNNLIKFLCIIVGNSMGAIFIEKMYNRKKLKNEK